MPAGTPDDVVKVLYTAMSKIVATEEFKSFMATNGFGIRIVTQEFGEFMAAQDRAWNAVLKLGGYTQ